MKYRILLPKGKRLILPEGQIKNTGNVDASLSITGPYPGLRQDMLTRLDGNTSALEQFKYAAEEYYLKKMDADAFIATSVRLAESSAEVKRLIPNVAMKFKEDNGFEAIQLIHRAVARQLG